MENLKAEANKVIEALPNDNEKSKAKQYTELIINDANNGTKSAFFDVSAKGLLEAAKTVGEVGVKLAGYIPQILDALGGE
ncbi:MAG: hypothetical protein KU38_04175 [Sulfurovum sp. FS08-3]|nr:MAG: hypothetical protein KU38_04175 [Sulfurovum sp. FS08-3]